MENKTGTLQQHKVNFEDLAIPMSFFTSFILGSTVMIVSLVWFFGKLKQDIALNAKHITELELDVNKQLLEMKEEFNESQRSFERQFKELKNDIQEFIKSEIVRSENNVINSLTYTFVQQKNINSQFASHIKSHSTKLEEINCRIARIGEDARESKSLSRFAMKYVNITPDDIVAREVINKTHSKPTTDTLFPNQPS